MMKTKEIKILGNECGECGGNYDVVADEPLMLYQLCGVGDHTTTIRLGEGAKAKVVFAALDGGDTSYTYRVELNGRGAEVELYGVFVAREGANIKVHTEMRHNAPRCRSNQQVRGVAAERGYGLFDGLVYVAPDAQQTEAYQQSRNVLLAPSARIQTQPQLEIYADDVKCSHGATVGQMNEEEIYYMRQRGLSEEDARRLQLGGFVQEIADKVADEALREEFERVINL
jgi:Fe-S cluster assembly protein SufD